MSEVDKSNTLEKGGESKLELTHYCHELESNTLEKGGESKHFAWGHPSENKSNTLEKGGGNQNVNMPPCASRISLTRWKKGGIKTF